jgi:hypothetical protein
MRSSKKFLLVPLLALASVQAFACYTVYDRDNRVVWQGDKPPVDMSRPLHETLPARFPGNPSMVFDDSTSCPVVISSVAIGAGGPVTRTSSPLLTDERTARELGLPHRNIGRNVAVVPPAAVGMEPGVTVVPAPTVASKSARGTVITEYRNPPVTVVRRGDEVIISDSQ